MSELNDRLNRLSPQKRALLALRLSRERAGQRSSGLPALEPDPRRRHDPFPLTDLQQAYWVGRSAAFEMGNVASHSYVEIETEALDIRRLERAWSMVVDRHDMLRAEVSRDGNQRVLERVPEYRIEVDDLRGLDRETVDSRLSERRSGMSHRMAASDSWPLFKIAVTILDEDVHRVHVSIDALVLDAWSIHIAFKEWARFYREPETAIEPLEVSFRDYVLAEGAIRRTADYRKAREYWREVIPSLPPAPALPLAVRSVDLEAPRFVRRTRRLDRDGWSRLKDRASARGLSSTGVLLAAYAQVLSLWGGARRFTLSIPAFNRLPLHEQIDQVVGEFASFGLLDVDNTGEAGFVERSRRIQERLWRDLDHALYNGVEVMRDLAVHNQGESTLMPVVFTSAPTGRDGQDATIDAAAEEIGRVIHSVNQTPQVWLDNHVAEHGGELVCDWDYVEQVFPSGMAEEMLESFFVMLDRLASIDECWDESWAETTNALLPGELKLQRASINGNSRPIPETLLQTAIYERTEIAPDDLAVIDTRRSLTYGELASEANRWGRRLRNLGARTERPVAIVMEKGWEQVVGAVSVLQSGAGYLPIDPELPVDRLQFILANAGADLVLTQSALSARIDWPIGVRVLQIDGEDISQVSDAPLAPVQTPDDLAYMIYTSGSTGSPKGVMIGHRGVVNSIACTNAEFEIGPSDRVLALTALHHDMSVYDIFGILAAGGTIVMPSARDRKDPAHWRELIQGHGVTIWNSVPAMMEMLLEYLEAGGQSLPAGLRLAFLGGDWIGLGIPDRLKAVAPGAHVVSVGGPTETTLWNIWYRVDGVPPEWKSIPYGKPIPNVRYYIFNEDLEECPTWVPGEMHCGGAGLALGYRGEEEGGASRFHRHPRTGERLYRTGDRGRYLPDGNIEFLGRLDFQIKLHGQRIELGEIEACMSGHPAVRSAVASLADDPTGKKFLAGYYVPENGSGPGLGELRRYLRRRLPDYMIPTAFVRLDVLPLTANGKVDRRALPSPAGADDQPSAAQPDKKPGSMTARVAGLVESVLGKTGLEYDRNLLNYGANSIDMVRIGNRLEKEFGYRPSMDRLFRLQTISAIAAHFEERLAGETRETGKSATRTAGDGIGQIISSYKLLTDPAEREEFKNIEPGLRRDLGDSRGVSLSPPEIDDRLISRYRERRSYRKFSLKPIRIDDFARFLSCLYRIELDGKPKYLYASPGGLYPTQIYVHTKPGRVEGMGAGIYYYDPAQHRLEEISANVELDRDIHIPFINTPIFDEAAFSVFLIVQLAAIAPSYGEHSIHFATVEAGIIAHLLEMTGPGCGIGLCQIGSLDFDRIRHLFKLDRSHVLIHSLLGGSIIGVGEKMNESETGGEWNRAADVLEKIKRLSGDEIKTLLDANRDLTQKGDGE